MNTSKVTYGVVLALLLNLATPVQAGWFTDLFASRNSKVAVAVGAVAVLAGLGYYLFKGKKTKFIATPAPVVKPTEPASDKSKSSTQPTRPGHKAIERLADAGIAKPTLPGNLVNQVTARANARKKAD